MPKSSLIILLIVQISILKGQQMDPSLAIDPKGEQLAKIAWEKSSFNKLYESNKQVAEHSMNSSKFSFLEGMGFSLNVNEFTINPVPGNNNFYPRYNFGYSFSIGQIMDMAGDVKEAKNQILKLDYERIEDSLRVRSNVLQKYEAYKLSYELMQMAKENVINVNSELGVIERDYSEGKVDIAQYKMIQDAYTSARSQELNAINAFFIAKIQLEEVLGMSLESAFRQIEGN